MNQDILKKAKRVLVQSEYSERDVIYFLVEAYKFLERKYGKEFGKGRYKCIKFYRDWACHSRLSGASYEVFRDFNNLIQQQMLQPSAYGQLDWIGAMAKKTRDCFREYGLLSLRAELIDLFGEMEYEGKSFNWESFRKNLYEVIRDIELVILAEKDKAPLFTFKCVEPLKPAEYDALEIQMNIPSIEFRFTLDDHSL